MSLTAVKIQTEARAYLQDTDWTSEEKDAFIQGFYFWDDYHLIWREFLEQYISKHIK
jgi:hypothetical protein